MALGVAEGFAAARKERLFSDRTDVARERTGIVQRKVDLLERQQQFAQRQEISAIARQRLNATLDISKQIFTNVQFANGDTVKAATAIRGHRKMLQPLIDRGLLNGDMVDASFDAVLSAPSPQQLAERKIVNDTLTKLHESRATKTAELESLRAKNLGGFATTKQQNVLAEGLTPGTPDFGARMRELNNKVSSGSTVNVNLPGGNVPLTKTTATAVQKSIIDLSSQLQELDILAGSYSKEFLTFAGQAKGGIAVFADKLGISSEEQQKFIAQKRQFTQAVNQIFNNYRREITGAAASVTELESLKEAVLNEDLSPAEFEAAFTQFRDQLARVLEFKNELATVGIDANTQEGGRELDRIMFSGNNALGVAPPVLTRTIGGKTYQKIDGEWFEVQ